MPGYAVTDFSSAIFFLTVAALWFGTSNAAREIVKERAVYLRERLINLRLFPYILSKVGVLTVLAILQTVALFWIVRLKTPHLPAQGILLPAPHKHSDRTILSRSSRASVAFQTADWGVSQAPA